VKSLDLPLYSESNIYYCFKIEIQKYQDGTPVTKSRPINNKYVLCMQFLALRKWKSWDNRRSVSAVATRRPQTHNKVFPVPVFHNVFVLYSYTEDELFSLSWNNFDGRHNHTLSNKGLGSNLLTFIHQFHTVFSNSNRSITHTLKCINGAHIYLKSHYCLEPNIS